MIRGQNLADVLIAYRQANGLSQSALASILGVDQSYISKIERGHRQVNDLQFLKRIVDRLGLDPLLLGLPLNTFTSKADDEILQCSNSIIALAEMARNSGHPEKAVMELRPLLVRLSSRSNRSPDDHTLLKMIARTRTILGTALGDLLPQNRLWEASRELAVALKIIDHLEGEERRRLPARPELLKKLGNELRKQGSHRKASDFLDRSLLLNEDIASRGSAALCLARLKADQNDKRGFAAALRMASNCLEQVDCFSPTFNPVAMHEVRLRGALKLGSLTERQIAAADEQMSIGLAPHWAIIREVTIAEAWLSVGNISEASCHAERAIDGALLCKMPRQISRVFDAFSEMEDPVSDDITDRAARGIARLSSLTHVVWPVTDMEELT